MYGKPLISSEIGTGTTFINIENETGLVVPPSQPAALAQAMRDLWNHPERAAAMGLRAEKRYWDLFTAERMVRSYLKTYGELIEIAGPPRRDRSRCPRRGDPFGGASKRALTHRPQRRRRLAAPRYQTAKGCASHHFSGTRP